MALSHSLRRKHAQVAAARRWADPETADRIQAEYQRDLLRDALEAVREQHPDVLEDLRRMVVVP